MYTPHPTLSTPALVLLTVVFAHPAVGEVVTGGVAYQPVIHEVTPTLGSAAPGCEADNTCYDPSDLTILIGDIVNFVNRDTAAHTFTSGTPADGPDGEFDSSLVLPGNSFEHTFNNLGVFPYFDIVHPWATGVVRVNAVPEPSSIALLAMCAGVAACGRSRRASTRRIVH